jgi:ParB family transcriptional regulator, chromosome partitioning protein
MELQHISIDDLKVSPLNVRKHGQKDGNDLVSSIRAIGLLQGNAVSMPCSKSPRKKAWSLSRVFL